MECFCDFCGWNTPSPREAQNRSTNSIELRSRNIEPIASLTEALLNRFHVSEPEIIDTNPSLPAVYYDLNSSAYDMSGEKFLYVFSQENYMKTSHFNFRRPPSSPNGTRDDANFLKETFLLCGFQVKIYYDMEYEQIIDIISRVSQQNHTATSCLCVAILSHATSNALLAADRPYRLLQLEILLQSENLAGIPKMLLLPCIRGGNEMPGVINRIPLQDEGASWDLPYNAAMDICCGCVDLAHQFYCHVFKQECPVCTICGASNVDPGVTVRCAAGNTTVLPRMSEFLFIHAANNDLVSLSILVRSLCNVLQEHEEDEGLEHGELIPLVNQKVADNTYPGTAIVIPETRITLAKSLRFTRTVPRRN